MYQSVLRDPGGDNIVRILSDTRIVDGSILIVPADTVAFFVCNGQISQKYTSGRYEIRTGVSPFFVRFRNLMTQGDPGISVSVFFVNVKQESFTSMGTGEIVFRESRFNISLKALGAFTIRYVVSEPYRFLQQLVGMHQETYYEEDIRPAIESLIKPYIREEIAKYLSQNDIHNFQNDLVSIGNGIQNTLKLQFLQYGISLRAVCITAINIPDEELARLNSLEDKYAGGIIDTDIELDNISRVYGDVNRRTITEVATSSVRGPASTRRGCDSTDNIAGTLATLPIQIAIANELISNLSGPMNDMMRQSNIFNGVQESESQRENARGSYGRTLVNGKNITPPLPQKAICKECGNKMNVDDVFCGKCGTNNKKED